MHEHLPEIITTGNARQWVHIVCFQNTLFVIDNVGSTSLSV